MQRNEATSGTGPFLCTRCHGSVPDDEIVVPEATNYLVHFCGLECYAAWRVSITETYRETFVSRDATD